MATPNEQDDAADMQGFKSPAPPLFPAACRSGSDLHQHTPLFPAAGENDAKSVPTAPLNWLKNSSFTNDAANSYQNFFEATQTTTKLLEPDIKPEDDGHGTDVTEPEPKRPKKRTKKEKTKKKKKKKKHSTSAAETLLDLERQLIAQNSKKVFIEDVGLKPEHAFRVDRKPDQVQAVFKAVYHLHLARYIIRSGRHNLGDVAETHGTAAAKKKLRSSRYFSRKSVSAFCTEAVSDLSCPRLVYTNEKFQKQVASYGSYIPLNISVNEVKKEANWDNDPLGIYSEETKAFILNVTSRSDQTTAESAVGELNVMPAKESGSKYATRRTAEFNQLLRENPHDEECWLEFIKFQNEAASKVWEYAADISSDQPLKRRTEKDLYERKLSIFEKALTANPKSIKLAVAKLRLCTGYCDFNSLKQEWKQLTFVHPNSMFMWREYLLFLQSNFTSFTVSSVVKGYEKCLLSLGKFLDGSFKSHAAPFDVEGSMIGIIYQLCQFLRQAGHCERAVAIFQALLEFNCYTPDNLQQKMSNSDWLAFFEPFWDSGVPRFGEKGAVGWSSVMQNKQFSDIAHLKTKIALEEIEDDVVKAMLPRHQTWVEIEKIREIHHWMPWRANPNDENDDCDDPERAVLVDDVASFLFRVNDPSSKFRLLAAFLTFLGMSLPVHPTTICESSHCHSSQVLQVPSQVIPMRKHYFYKFEKQSTLPQPFNISDYLPLDPREFIDNAIEQASNWLPTVHQSDLKVWRMQHTRAVLSRTRDNSEQTAAKHAFKETRKSFKNLLKEEANRNNLALWSEYVKLELDANNIMEVKKVCELILQSQPKGPLQMDNSDQASLLCNFYRLYAEIELGFSSNSAIRSTDNSKALHIVTSLSIGEAYSSASEVTPALILKARRCYQSAMKTVSDAYKVNVKSADKMSWLFFPKTNFLLEFVPCYALFQYLTLGLHPATVLYDGILDMISELRRETSDEMQTYLLKIDTELLYLSYVSLVLHHVNTTASSLKIIRTVLVRALQTFPNNSHLLHLLLDIESRSSIAGRLRKHFNHWLQSDQAPVIGIYAVLAELIRQQSLKEFQQLADSHFALPELPSTTEMGINQKIQAVFERAVALAEGRHCPLLWRLYLKFQFLQGNKKKAKAIFYRALQCCPWNKALYLDAAVMFTDDLQEVLDIMTEKEIRIRAPIEEIDLLTGFVAPTTTNDVEKLDNVADDDVDKDLSVEQI